MNLLRVEKNTGVAARWDVFGLEVLGRNRVEGVDQLMPFKEWLACFLADVERVSVLVGGTVLEDSDYAPMPPHVRVNTTIYCGDLHAGEPDHPTWRGAFFPSVTTALLLHPLFDAWYRGDNAVMVMPEVEDATGVIGVLDGFESEESTLQRLETAAGWVIQPGHDGYYLHLWDSDADASRIARCSERVETALGSLPWVVENRDRLVWDEGYMCYALAELLAGG